MLTGHLVTIKKCIPDKNPKDEAPLVSALIKPSELEVHRQVPLTNAKIAPSTKIALHKLLNTFKSIISKNSNDIGQTMHIAIRPDATPIAACPYPLAIKHCDFLKQEIQDLLDAGMLHKSMSPWASPTVVVK